MSLSCLSKGLIALGLGALGLLCLLTLSSVQAQPQGSPGIFKDLQVLPKDITKAELKTMMKAQSKALGVDCDHCHKEPDMHADHPKKTIAREMMRMTAELNKKYRSTTNGKVTCWSCHRGQKLPDSAPK